MSRSSGRSSSQRETEGCSRWRRSPDSACLCPFKPRLSQIKSSFLSPLNLPLGPSSTYPMLIYNLQPSRPKFFLYHTPLPNSDHLSSSRSGLQDTRNSKGEKALKNNQSQLSLVHLASQFPSKKKLSFE